MYKAVIVNCYQCISCNRYYSTILILFLIKYWYFYNRFYYSLSVQKLNKYWKSGFCFHSFLLVYWFYFFFSFIMWFSFIFSIILFSNNDIFWIIIWWYFDIIVPTEIVGYHCYAWHIVLPWKLDYSIILYCHELTLLPYEIILIESEIFNDL